MINMTQNLASSADSRYENVGAVITTVPMGKKPARGRQKLALLSQPAAQSELNPKAAHISDFSKRRARLPFWFYSIWGQMERSQMMLKRTEVTPVSSGLRKSL